MENKYTSQVAGLYIFTCRAKTQLQRISYFVNHLNRCKKTLDKIKLMSLIILESAVFDFIKNEIIVILKSLKNSLAPCFLPSKRQLLLTQNTIG